MIAAALSACVCACADLATFELNGACGNTIVEESAGEVCDGKSEPGTTCGAPGSLHACQFICSREGTGCPPDWGCGEDLKCRPADVGLEREQILDLHRDDGRVAIGDFDGDGLADLLRVSAIEARVRYGDQSRPLEDLSVIAPIDGALDSAVADVDRDGLEDVVIPHPLGFRVLHGTTARELIPLAMVEDVGETVRNEWRIMRTEAIEPFHDLVRIRVTENAIDVFFPQSSTSTPVFSLTEVCADNPFAGGCLNVGFGPTANIDPLRGGADEIFAYAYGANYIRVYSPVCQGPAGARTCNVIARSPIFIPTNALDIPGPLSMRFADVDGNGALDLMVERTGDPPIAVAYSDGDRLFCGHPHPEHGCERKELNVARHEPFFKWLDGCGNGLRLPVAAADLDGDGDTDYISDGIYLTDTDALPDDLDLATCIDVGNAEPYEVAIGDYNRDGYPDAAVLRRFGSQLVLFLGSTEGIFNRRTIGFPAGARDAVTGDFDGDGIDDLAVLVADPRSQLGTQVWLMYGSQDLGRLAPFLAIEAALDSEQLLTGHLVGDSGRSLWGERPNEVDLVSDLLVAGGEGLGSVAVLAGRSERAFASVRPVALLPELEPAAVVAGRFAPVPDFEPKELIVLLSTGKDADRRLGGAMLIGRRGQPDRPLELDCEHNLYFSTGGPLGFHPAIQAIQAIDVDGDRLDELYWIRNPRERFVLRIEEHRLICVPQPELARAEGLAVRALPGGGVVLAESIGFGGRLFAQRTDGSEVSTNLPTGAARGAEALAVSDAEGRPLITLLDDIGVHRFELRADGFAFLRTLYGFSAESVGVRPGFTPQGSSIEAVDFNGDRLDDVVIHARSSANDPDGVGRTPGLRGETATLLYLRTSDFGR